MKKGFTLIELLVIMTIIGILSSILFSARGIEEKKLALQRSIFQLSQDLREIQGLAMGFWEESCPGGTATGFGIHLHRVSLPESYLLYADCNDNQHKDGSDKILREVKLEKGVQVQSLSPSPLDIVFVPPEPATFIDGVESGREGVITLSLKSDSSKQKVLRVNTAGKIEIE